MNIEPEADEAAKDWQQALLGGGNLDLSVPSSAALMSIAISMKRIADVLAGDDNHMDLVNSLMQAVETGIRNRG